MSDIAQKENSPIRPSSSLSVEQAKVKLLNNINACAVAHEEGHWFGPVIIPESVDALIASVRAEQQEIDREREGLRRFLSGVQVGATTNIADEPSYGYGQCDNNGFWEFPVHPGVVRLRAEAREAIKRAEAAEQEITRLQKEQKEEMHLGAQSATGVASACPIVHADQLSHDGSWSERFWAEPHRRPVVEWLQSRGYVWDRGLLAIAWSTRSGYDFTDLQFYPLARHANDIGVDAIIGHHASGENPRMAIGTCETLAEVQEIHDLIRRLNGYKGPEPDRTVVGYHGTQSSTEPASSAQSDVAQETPSNSLTHHD